MREYERVRAHSRRFVVAPGHRAAGRRDDHRGSSRLHGGRETRPSGNGRRGIRPSGLIARCDRLSVEPKPHPELAALSGTTTHNSPPATAAVTWTCPKPRPYAYSTTWVTASETGRRIASRRSPLTPTFAATSATEHRATGARSQPSNCVIARALRPGKPCRSVKRGDRSSQGPRDLHLGDANLLGDLGLRTVVEEAEVNYPLLATPTACALRWLPSQGLRLVQSRRPVGRTCRSAFRPRRRCHRVGGRAKMSGARLRPLAPRACRRC